MDAVTLSILWYLVVGVSIVFYVILDGFDLGVGMLHLFVKKDEERRIFLNAIGPVWDGNEVWLIIVGGALFAGFPDVYATLFSGFYNLCMILLFGLIFRAVAIEMRSKQPSPTWRSAWDRMFFFASLIIAFGIGVTLGNLIEGIPLDADGNFTGTFAIFFRPYALLIGLLSVTLLLMHGAIYLTLKTEGKLQKTLRGWAKRCMVIFILCYLASTLATWVYMPHMFDRIRANPWLWGLGLIALLAILNIPREFDRKNDGRAFIFSCSGIFFLFLLFGIGMYPTLVRSTIDAEQHSLTIFNSSSSLLTMKVLLIIVAIGVPLVLAYGTYIYRTFRGKVKLGPSSY